MKNIENYEESLSASTNTDLNLNLYTKKISRYGTLSAEQEKKLAKLAKEGSSDAKKNAY